MGVSIFYSRTITLIDNNETIHSEKLAAKPRDKILLTVFYHS